MLFTERDRQIYTAPTGTKYDPVELFHKLEAAASGHLIDLLDRWWGDESGAGERAQAALALAKAARQAFGFKPFDEQGGVLDADALTALYDFLQWREKKD